MKRLLVFIFTLSFTYGFGQRDEIVIGKSYHASQDSTVEKVYISLENNLGFGLKNIRLMHDKQVILTIKSLKSEEKKCFSFSKNELKGKRTFILHYGKMVDRSDNTDDVRYDFHGLELSGGNPLPAKVRKVKSKEGVTKEDEFFTPSSCNYKHQKL